MRRLLWLALGCTLIILVLATTRLVRAATATMTSVVSAAVTPTPTPGAVPAESTRPRLACEPAYVTPAETITVTGENFQPGGQFHELRWDGVVIPWSPAGQTVGDDGRLTVWFAAPDDIFGLHTLVADDGAGGQAECYVDLVPRDPTPTATATPTLTPTPTTTWTPGPPPGITVTPTAIPTETDFCADIEAVFTRQPVAGGTVTVGLEITNPHRSWNAAELALGLWQYQTLAESDTGLRVSLPSLATGESATLSFSFAAPSEPGPVWYQLRLVDRATDQPAGCPSDWFPLYLEAAAPYPPPLVSPADGSWLNTRQLSLTWGLAPIPANAPAVDRYEVQLLDSAGTTVLSRMVPAAEAQLSHTLATDYGADELAWRVRGGSAAGWGGWTSAMSFGVDTTPPVIDLTILAEAGDNGWWRSPLTVEVDGLDPGDGSGLTATYLQPGPTAWQQVSPGQTTPVDRTGEFYLRAYGRDRALNRSAVVVKPVKVDYEPPHRLVARFSAEATASGWYTVPLALTIEAEDAISGVAAGAVRLVGDSWQTGTLTLKREGQYQLEFKARDVAGNETETRQTSARLDLTPPGGALALVGSLCQPCPPLTVTVSTGDSQSGVAHWVLSLTGSDNSPGDLFAQSSTILASGVAAEQAVILAGNDLPPGPLTLTLTVEDTAGWVSEQSLAVVNQTGSAGPTPTPWRQATATPWPSPTPGVWPYAPATPTPTVSRSQPEQDRDDDQPGSPTVGSPQPTGGYPVGEQAVPVILPVTGRNK